MSPELLRLLLEMRAEAAAIRELIVSRLDRLDQRVARMERNRANAPDLIADCSNTSSIGGGGTLARRVIQPRLRQLRLVDLSAEVLAIVAAALPEFDQLAAALSCRKLRAAIKDATEGRSDRIFTAASSAFSSMAKLVWSVSCGLPASPLLCARAAKLGQLPQLSWMRSRGCPWDEQTSSIAAKYGHLDVLQWARAGGCPWTNEVCELAALEVLQWARTNGCLWGEETCSDAASGGHLAVLQWARANGCPWNEAACKAAAVGGHLAVLQWARANGCPWRGDLLQGS